MHIWGKGRAAGRVRLFVGNLGSGQRFVGLGRVESGPRKVTHGQLWPIHVLTELNITYLWFLGEIIITQRHMASPCYVQFESDSSGTWNNDDSFFKN